VSSLSLWAVTAVLAGAAIATQSGLNSQLGVLLKNPLIATTIAFSFSALFTLIALLAFTKNYPQLADIKVVPAYLWFSGSFFSAFGVAMFFYLAPKMGVGSMMSYALSGQIVVAIISSHFGWFDLPLKPITALKLLGVVALIGGILLINWQK